MNKKYQNDPLAFEQKELFNSKMRKLNNSKQKKSIGNFTAKKTLIQVNKNAVDFDITGIDFQLNHLIKYFADKHDHVTIRYLSKH